MTTPAASFFPAGAPGASRGTVGLVAGVLLAVALGGCGDSRFPGCKTDAECAATDAGPADPRHPVCYNLKCVECRYDTDCAGGAACDLSKNACEAGSTPRPGDKDAGEVTTAWEHGSWDQCAADCKDRECIQACDEKFKK
jgi:hypothetical protein